MAILAFAMSLFRFFQDQELTGKLYLKNTIVLSDFFGNNFSFDDDTEILYGLPVRRFPSFMVEANEAAISRLYGGIHFRDTIVHAQEMGRQVKQF